MLTINENERPLLMSASDALKEEISIAVAKFTKVTQVIPKVVINVESVSKGQYSGIWAKVDVSVNIDL